MSQESLDELNSRITRLKQRQNGQPYGKQQTTGSRDDSTEEPAQPVKRRPGRPRKNSEVAQGANSNAASASTQGIPNTRQTGTRRRSDQPDRTYSSGDALSASHTDTIDIDGGDQQEFRGDASRGRGESTDDGGIVESVYHEHGSSSNSSRQTRDGDSGVNARGDRTTANSARITPTITTTLKNTARKQAQRGLRLVADLGKDADEDTDDEKPKKQKESDSGSGSGSGSVIGRAQAALGRATARITADHRKLFSAREADARRDDIAEMLQEWGDDLNKFLSISATVAAECDIWELDDDEADALAGSWLKRAQRNEQAAALLRLALEGDDDLKSIIVLGPRLWRTEKWYPEHGGFKLAHWETK